jgi:hypothetical protein
MIPYVGTDLHLYNLHLYILHISYRYQVHASICHALRGQYV